MVALAHAHEPQQVGAPSYVGGPRPGLAGSGKPALHKFDKTDFVPRFIAELQEAVGAQRRPGSYLPPLAPDIDASVSDFDVDAYDFLGARFRKLYMPAHFRFYLAACELRCLVPGFPAPARASIKKVEMVIRRVAVRKGGKGEGPIVETGREWAWVPIPDPRGFPDGAPSVALDLAPRLTGNTHTWWPLPDGQDAIENEERQALTRAFAPGLEARAIYFGFLPLASGAMYGPRVAPAGTTAPSIPAADVHPIRPLVAAPESYPLSPTTRRGFKRNWQKLLGTFSDGVIDAPRPKFEPPSFDGDPDGGWAYVVRTVATFEPTPGCVYEVWSEPSDPMLVAPHFDPFGGRPVQIDIPSVATITKMIGTLTPPQLAARGALNVGMKKADCMPDISVSGSGGVTVKVPPPGCTPNEICFFGFPLITIAAYLMLSIALVLLFPLSFLLKLKFCLPWKK
jgi:hypothetical protein